MVRTLFLITSLVLLTGGRTTGQEYFDNVDRPSIPIVSDSRSPTYTASADYLLMRPHFSEAVAFAHGTQTANSLDISGRPLDFSYQSGLRAGLTVPIAYGQETLEVRYFFYDGDVQEIGTAPPGQFIIDPFGNVVGTLVDPITMGLLPSGDLIRTEASVKANVYDGLLNSNWDFQTGSLELGAGIRVADIEQWYSSSITNGGAFFSQGTFSTRFVGAGPLVSLTGTKYLLGGDRISLVADIQGAMLLGQYEVGFTNTITQPGLIAASQSNEATHTIPVLESEIGIEWNVSEYITLNTGWLFNAWFDLGTSGGRFGGFFTGADDSNIMSFDGLIVRLEVTR